MRIINISASAENHLGDNFAEFMEQINSATIAVVEPLSAYGFVQNGVEHVHIECDGEAGVAHCDEKRKDGLFAEAMRLLLADNDASPLIFRMMNTPEDVVKKLIDAGWRPLKE